MEVHLIHRIYEYMARIINHDEVSDVNKLVTIQELNKTCPITGLDITMQAANSKFLSYTGVKWYYENDYNTYSKKLIPFLSKPNNSKNIQLQHKSIAHNIRNADSNPRNNKKRAINKLLTDTSCLFDNRVLIDIKLIEQCNLNNPS